MPVVQVKHEIEGATERGKVLSSRLGRRFLCLEISPAKNLVGITQATPLEPHAHRGANDMRRRDGHERVVRGALCGRMAHGAELLYALPHGRFVDRKQGHDEVILLKRLPLRVHAHEDVRYGLLVSRFGNLQCRQKITLKPEQCVEPALDGILAAIVEFGFALFGIRLVKALDERPAIGAQLVVVVRREGLGYVRHIARIPLGRGVGILE